MDSKVFHLFMCFFVLLSLSISSCHPDISPQSRHGMKSFSSNKIYMEKLIGAQKGDKITGLHEIKAYLTHFGYLDYKTSYDKAHEADDVFDNSLELALKAYQSFYKLNPTGILDANTVAIMSQPRCGVPDTFKQEKSDVILNDSIRVGSHYSFFPGQPQWPPSRRDLTFSLAPGTRADAKDPILEALNKWASVTGFKFTYIEAYDQAVIKLSFQRRDHGDGSPFDGPLGILAHAFAPTDGTVHFDGDENWSLAYQVIPNEFDLESIALHELGHTLGLGHSNVSGSVMFPIIGPGVEKRDLTPDDIEGIKTLYNLK